MKKESYKSYMNNLDKGKAFDRVAELLYSNFGSVSKSDIELLMFDILLEAMKAANSADNILEYL